LPTLVLGSPDNQELSEQAEDYEGLTEAAPALRMADVAPNKTSAWLLSLDRRWVPCGVEHIAGPLIITEANDGIRGGMSGSPILNDTGLAVGVVCISGGTHGDELHTTGGPNPRLAYALPGWIAPRLHYRKACGQQP
jgi:hypothetical protein